MFLASIVLSLFCVLALHIEYWYIFRKGDRCKERYWNPRTEAPRQSSVVNMLAWLLPIYKLAVTFLLVPHFDKGTNNFTRNEDNKQTCIFEGFLKGIAK